MAKPSLADIAVAHKVELEALEFEIARIKKHFTRVEKIKTGVVSKREILQPIKTAKSAGDKLADVQHLLPIEFFSDEYLDAFEAFTLAHRYEQSRLTLALETLSQRKAMPIGVFRKEAMLSPLIASYKFLTGKEPSCYEDKLSDKRVLRGAFYEFLRDLAPYLGIDQSDVNKLANRFIARPT